MQKLEQESNANIVGAGPVSAQEKGITLIALIITIIVMLILVGVTINVALNGGLFQKADTAKTQTQLAADREELQIEIATAYNEKERAVNLETLATNLRAKGWEVTDSGDKLICTSKNGNTFEVDAKAKITEGDNNSGIGNKPTGFDWNNLNLKVDTKSYYEFYTANSKYVMQFREDGNVEIKKDGNTLDIVDATDSNNIDMVTGNLKIILEGNNVTLSTNTNGNDIDAIIEGAGPVIFAKNQGNTTTGTSEWIMFSYGIPGDPNDRIIIYTGNETNLTITNAVLNVERVFLGEEEGSFIRTGEVTPYNLNNSAIICIYSDRAPNVESIDFGNVLGKGTEVDCINHGKIKEINGLEGASSIRVYGCKALESITIPSTIEALDNTSPFYSCTNLTNITVNKPKGSLDFTNSGLSQEQIDNINWIG